MNIFMHPKITQKQAGSFHWKHQKNTIFTSIAAQRELYQSEKGQRKNLA